MINLVVIFLCSSYPSADFGIERIADLLIGIHRNVLTVVLIEVDAGLEEETCSNDEKHGPNKMVDFVLGTSQSI